ncbi:MULTISPECIES: hypothetical protein [unclassified Flagellimonas]|nr:MULTISPECIES: hypothetical protein [unclassified Flagellimonas]
MNTKKVFFGFLAIAFLAMTAISTNVMDINPDQTVSVDKLKIGKR